MRITDYLKVFLILFSTLILASCVDAAVTGAQVAYNHGAIQKNLNDQYITSQINHKLYVNAQELKDTNLDIATFNQEVLITGQVATPEQKAFVEQTVKSVPGINKVYNLAAISPPTPTLKRASDVWITAKIRARLVAMNDIEPNKIKVVTENGTVYLMGVVLQDQADIAIDIARNTDGVERVVKMFTYLRISKV